MTSERSVILPGNLQDTSQPFASAMLRYGGTIPEDCEGTSEEGYFNVPERLQSEATPLPVGLQNITQQDHGRRSTSIVFKRRLVYFLL
jgi:hypothetical protein